MNKIYIPPTVSEMKVKMRLDINLCLITASFTVFALIVTLNPALFFGSFLLPLQLTVSIPLLLSSTFARSRMAQTARPIMWERYGFFTFLISYSFLINVLGTLLAAYIGLAVGLTFLVVNIFMALLYSLFEIIEDRRKLPSRMQKDLLFIGLVLCGGILPALGWY